MTTYSDIFSDASGVALESHATNTWVKQTGYSAGSLAISNANRVRQNAAGQVSQYYVNSSSPSTAYFDVSVVTHMFSLAGSAGLAVRCSTTDQSCYRVAWGNNNRIGLYKVSSTNVATQLNNVALVTTAWSAGDDHTIKISTRDGGSGNPRFLVYLDGTQIFDQTDNSTPLAATGKVGIYVQGNSGATTQNLLDTTGFHLDNFAVSDLSSLSANVSTLPPTTSAATAFLTGVGTAWTPGTPGSPTFTIATVPNPGTPPTIAAQTVNSTTTATLTVNTGTAATGAVITVTDPSTNNTVSFTVAAVLTGGTATLGTVTATSIAVSATPASGGTLPYRYQWYRGPVGFSIGPGTALTGATGLTLNDTAVAYPTTYEYVCVVTDATGTSANTNRVSQQPPAPSVLTAGAITIGAVGPNSVALTSTSPTGGVGPYTQQLYRSQVQSFTPGPGTAIAGATTLTYTDTGVAPNQTYYYIMLYTDSQNTVVASTVWATPPASATTTAAGAATGLTLLPPGSGPQSYVTDVSALWTVALSPLGATVASPVVVTLVESGNTGTFLAADGVTPITTVTLSTGTPSVQFRLSDPTAGVKTVSITNTVALTVPAAITYTVMTTAQQAIGVMIAPGATFAGQAANLAYSVEDGVGTVIVPVTTGQAYEGKAGSGTYYMWPVVANDVAGSVIVTGLTGTNAPSYQLEFFPSKPTAATLGARDTAAIRANLATTLLGTDGRALVSADVHTAGVTVANLTSKTGMVLAATGLDAVNPTPDVTTSNRRNDFMHELGMLVRAFARGRSETPSGVLTFLNDAGVAYLVADISKPDGITTTVTPR